MKAVVIDAFGSADSLEIRDVETPAPEVGQVLIETRAASVNPIDWKIREGMMRQLYGADFPMILGFDVAGIVAAVGSGVSDFSIGDEVYARSDNGPGKCYAEYVAVSAGVAAAKPANLSHSESAALPLAALTALNGLRNPGNLSAGQRVLVNGASGGVGTFAVQIAANMGVSVTGVCSTGNIELVRSLGAAATIDYTTDDPLLTGDKYDVIYDTVGSFEFGAARSCLSENGVYVTLVPAPGIEFYVPGKSVREGQHGYFLVWTPATADLERLSRWAEAGSLRPIIDSEFPLEEIRAAHLRSETERARGKIVVTV